jgi:hypothetical protein
VEFSIGVKQRKSIRALIDLIGEGAWVTLEDYPKTGEAQIAETKLGDWRLIVRRTRLVGARAQLFPPDRGCAPPPAVPDPRATDPHRPPMDTPNACPLAMATRLR